VGEILGLGLTHCPPLAVTDEHMADILRHALGSGHPCRAEGPGELAGADAH